MNLSSELFLGHSDLKPEVQTENLSLLLTTADWDRLNDDYITSVKVRSFPLSPCVSWEGMGTLASQAEVSYCYIVIES